VVEKAPMVHAIAATRAIHEIRGVCSCSPCRPRP
jgi:hypothetical protein